jgi:hypothetical protein
MSLSGLMAASLALPLAIVRNESRESGMTILLDLAIGNGNLHLGERLACSKPKAAWRTGHGSTKLEILWLSQDHKLHFL